MKIAVAGAGYVGLSNALLLAVHHSVVVLDIDASRIEALNRRELPIADSYMAASLKSMDCDLTGTLDPLRAYSDADYVIIATPTDYDTHLNSFNTKSVEAVTKQALAISPTAVIVIKSTVPVGFTAKLQSLYPLANILFSPEFLREGKALWDNEHPSRIIVGGERDIGSKFADVMQSCASTQAPILLTDTSEAEGIKLFSNTYLAMRVAFMNELDTYAQIHGLNAEHIISGVGLDPRIGGHYSNPSFGYGGYCLPKDTKQLLASYDGVPNDLIKAIVQSNNTRKDFIAETIIKKSPKLVGIYRLVMKEGADNIRSSSMVDILERLIAEGVPVVVFEPLLDEPEFMGVPVFSDLEAFKQECDLIVGNRVQKHGELADVLSKVYTRDLFGRDV